MNQPNFRTVFFEEPEIMFGDNQVTADPREGLILFGPHEKLRHYSIVAGVVGTKRGIDNYKEFVKALNMPIISTKWSYPAKSHVSDELQRPSFPGFEAVFNVKWSPQPDLEIEIDFTEIATILRTVRNKKKRADALVDLYLAKILDAKSKEDIQPNIWFILVPKKIWEDCRPNSFGTDISSSTRTYIEQRKTGQLSLYDDTAYLNEVERLINSSSDFHHLLKARLIQEQVEAPSQILVEPKLQFRDILRNTKYEPNMRAHVAWTISTTVYYKLGKLPWKLSGIRSGVCYLGLVFKKLNDEEGSSVCSAAQMFLKDGDGAVFRGNIGLWETEKPHEYHLDDKAAYELLSMALEDYKEKWGDYPLELFIHGRVDFSESEWSGFAKVIEEKKARTNLVGVVIKSKAPLKLFRDAPSQKNEYGVLRGFGLIINEKEGYLNSIGFVPRLNTSLSMEIPNTLYIKVAKGVGDIETVMKDVFALTKLNYNACVYGDGKPVTLSFSDKIGGILTATDRWKVDTRQFKYYI